MMNEGEKSMNTPLEQSIEAGEMKKLFGNDVEVIYSYTRKQAIDDGVLVELSCPIHASERMAEVAKQHYPGLSIVCTAAVWSIIDKAVKNKRHCNDYAGILDDMLWMSKVMKRNLSEDTKLFRVIITGAARKKIFDFKMQIHGDDEGKPCLTIMLPNED